MIVNESSVIRLARAPRCPRCHMNKTFGNAICGRCRVKLPSNMRPSLEKVEQKDPWTVARALAQAANYFTVHFQSIRNFGGGRKR
jgi:predicted amidophosphoribosyltransferase